MKKRKLKQYFNKEWTTARKSLKVFIEKNDAEALHRFRVQVKKMRAFLVLQLDIDDPERLNKHFKSLRKIFRKAGAIRDAQLHIDLGRQEGAGSDFLNRQNRQLKKKARRFRHHGRSYLKQASGSYQHIRHHIRSLSGKDIRTFYTEQLRWIADHIGDGKLILHACRKRIKVLIYDYTFARKALRQDLNKDYLKALEKAIGKWHDNTLASQLFPALQRKESDLLKHITVLSEDFYNKAIAAGQYA